MLVKYKENESHTPLIGMKTNTIAMMNNINVLKNLKMYLLHGSAIHF